MDLSNTRIAVIGLGYVGRTLAAGFGKHHAVVGFETNPTHVAGMQTVEGDTLAASPEARNQMYNVAVGNPTTLNTLFELLRDNLVANDVDGNTQPEYRDSRAGAVRHPLAETKKATRLLGCSATLLSSTSNAASPRPCPGTPKTNSDQGQSVPERAPCPNPI